jgi:hypothetical protein
LTAARSIASTPRLPIAGKAWSPNTRTPTFDVPSAVPLRLGVLVVVPAVRLRIERQSRMLKQAAARVGEWGRAAAPRGHRGHWLVARLRKNRCRPIGCLPAKHKRQARAAPLARYRRSAEYGNDFAETVPTVRGSSLKRRPARCWASPSHRRRSNAPTTAHQPPGCSIVRSRATSLRTRHLLLQVLDELS